MKSIIAVMAVLVFALPALAVAQDQPKPTPLPGGEFIIQGDSMVISMSVPLAKQRETLYGNHVQGKSGPDLSQEKDVEAWVKDLREQLMRLTTSTGKFTLRSVIVTYDQMILTRYNGSDWEPVVKMLEAALKEATKGKPVKGGAK